MRVSQEIWTRRCVSEGFLDIKVRRVVNDTPGQKHYTLDLGGEGTLDFFEAKPGTEASQRDAMGALNHLAITADPKFIDEAEQRLAAGVIGPGNRTGRTKDDLLR